jgi:hypothetical protein
MYLSDNLDEGYLCEWLYSQPCWDSSAGSLARLKLLAKLENTNEGPDYYFQGVVAPKQYLQSGVGGLENVSDEFSLPEGTIIWGIGATSLIIAPSLPPVQLDRDIHTMNLGVGPPGGATPTPEGLKLQIFERGSQQYLYGRTYGKDNVVTGKNDNTLPYPNGIYIMEDPIFVVPPGQIQILIANLSQQTAFIQVFLACAFPLNKGVTGVYSQRSAQ